MKAKIFYITACRECFHCINSSHNRDSTGTCIETEKEIRDTDTISDDCELEDATEFIKWKKENEKNNQMAQV